MCEDSLTGMFLMKQLELMLTFLDGVFVLITQLVPILVEHLKVFDVESIFFLQRSLQTLDHFFWLMKPFLDSQVAHLKCEELIQGISFQVRSSENQEPIWIFKRNHRCFPASDWLKPIWLKGHPATCLEVKETDIIYNAGVLKWIKLIVSSPIDDQISFFDVKSRMLESGDRWAAFSFDNFYLSKDRGGLDRVFDSKRYLANFFDDDWFVSNSEKFGREAGSSV